MVIALYFLALVLAVVAINVWSKSEDEATDGRQATLLNVCATAAGLVVLVLFGWGFLLFSWYVPLAALVTGVFMGTVGAMLARRSDSAVGAAVASGVASVVLAAAIASVTLLG